MNGLGFSDAVQATELKCIAHILERERVISAAHPFAGRLIVTPGGFVAEHDFHCTSGIKLHWRARVKNQGRNVINVT